MSDGSNLTAPRSSDRVGVGEGEDGCDCVDWCEVVLDPPHPLATVAAAMLRQAK
jgi:hypothetical protein